MSCQKRLVDFYPKNFPARDMERMSRPSTWFIASPCLGIRTKRVGKQGGTFGEKSSEKGDLCKYRMDPIHCHVFSFIGRVRFSNEILGRFFCSVYKSLIDWCKLSRVLSCIISHFPFSSSELSVIFSIGNFRFKLLRLMLISEQI